MNFYIVVEGEVGEKLIYKEWIPLVNKNLKYVKNIWEIESNNFSIISGGGYPNYLEVVISAIQDINDYKNVDKLIIAVDSEDQTLEQKHEEVMECLLQNPCNKDTEIIVQHFCMETWALGNAKLIKQNPQSELLRKFIKLYNVKRDDPELLPPNEEIGLNRAQFAFKYLKHAILERNKRTTYTKSNPKHLLHGKYFAEVKARFEQTGHIKSFSKFLSVFSN